MPSHVANLLGIPYHMDQPRPLLLNLQRSCTVNQHRLMRLQACYHLFSQTSLGLSAALPQVMSKFQHQIPARPQARLRRVLGNLGKVFTIHQDSCRLEVDRSIGTSWTDHVTR